MSFKGLPQVVKCSCGMDMNRCESSRLWAQPYIYVYMCQQRCSSVPICKICEETDLMDENKVWALGYWRHIAKHYGLIIEKESCFVDWEINGTNIGSASHPVYIASLEILIPQITFLHTRMDKLGFHNMLDEMDDSYSWSFFSYVVEFIALHGSYCATCGSDYDSFPTLDIVIEHMKNNHINEGAEFNDMDVLKKMILHIRE